MEPSNGPPNHRCDPVAIQLRRTDNLGGHSLFAIAVLVLLLSSGNSTVVVAIVAGEVIFLEHSTDTEAPGFP